MNDSGKIIIIAFVLLSLILILGISLTNIIGFVWLGNFLEEYKNPKQILESFVDEQIEAGFLNTEISSTDPLIMERKILITTTINEHVSKSVSSRLLYLNAMDDSEPIDFIIATPGGWSDSAFTIINTMRFIEAPVNTWCIGGCYSAGALLLTSGTGRRFSSEHAIIMVHTNLEDSSEEYSFHRIVLDRYEKVWKDTAKLPDDWFPMTNGKRYYLTPEEALKLGIIDEIFKRNP